MRLLSMRVEERILALVVEEDRLSQRHAGPGFGSGSRPWSRYGQTGGADGGHSWDYNIQRDENLKLRDFPTLKHVIGFVYSKRPDLAVAPPQCREQAAAPVHARCAGCGSRCRQRECGRGRSGAGSHSDLVVEKTGYPKDMLDLDLDLEADLGVDTVKQAELMAAIRGIYNIPRDENLKLRDFPTLAHVIKFAHDKLAARAEHPLQPALPRSREKPRAAAGCARRLRSWPRLTRRTVFHAACRYQCCVRRSPFVSLQALP